MFGPALHRKIKTQILEQPNPETKGKKIFLEHILRPIQIPISSLPDNFGIGVKMTSKNIFFTIVSGFGFFCVPRMKAHLTHLLILRFVSFILHFPRIHEFSRIFVYRDFLQFENLSFASGWFSPTDLK